jgi:3D (Asp-Asp-Asp) domain-containing protein
MKKHLKMLPVLAMLIAVIGSPVGPAQAAAPPGPFFNGFEKNLDGWYDTTSPGPFPNTGSGFITRQMSGYSNGGGYADGIASAAGHWHARATGDCTFDCPGPKTTWGGYTSVFPQGGYRTQLDIYLDVSWAASHQDARFDFSSAINRSTPPNPPTHLRDFVFNAGTNPALDPAPPGFYINASTNAGRSGAFPENPCPNPPPCRTPVHITTSGWYTFQHTFRDEAGMLAVDMRIFPAGGNTPVPGADWTIRAGDLMTTVGGNRYGLFAVEEIPDLPIDNSLRTGLCRSGQGDGDVEDSSSGKHGHAHFKGDACEGGSKSGDVEETDQTSGDRFQSSSLTSATFTQEEGSQTLTMVGVGTHNGLPAAFTMIAVDNGTLGPALFSLVLSDGYVITGTVVSGTVAVQ